MAFKINSTSSIVIQNTNSTELISDKMRWSVVCLNYAKQINK